MNKLAFIKRVIDDCDYYLLIIGGRYGSMDETGISYTEQEYDYAVKKGLKVIALIHENPEEIPFGKSEGDPAIREKLNKFREKVAKGRLVKFWKSAEQLPGLVAINLLHAINTYPATGWVRANKVASEEMLAEINEVRKANEAMKKLIADLNPLPKVERLAELDEEVVAHGKYWNAYYRDWRKWELPTTWRKIFSYISPYLLQFPNEDAVKIILTQALSKDLSDSTQVIGRDRDGDRDSLDSQFFQTIAVQLSALGLVKREYSQTTSGSMAMFWSLTGAGERSMMDLRTVRTKTSSSEANT